MRSIEAPRLQLPKVDTRVSRDYELRNNIPLTNYVQSIFDGPNGPRGFISEDRLITSARTLDVNAALQRLPSGMTAEDFTGVLFLSMLTECATDTYGKAFDESADENNQPWLKVFNNHIWKPDEYTHYIPSKVALMQMGFSEAELDRQIKETREIEYHHVDGYTPVGLTDFGMIQEYLTDEWYGCIENVLAETNPEVAKGIRMVKRREALHAIWYRDMTKFQLEENPSLLPQIVEVTRTFEMPSHEVVPVYQAKGNDWMEQMGFDMSGKGKRNLVKFIAYTLGSTRNLGKFAMEYADQEGMKIGPIDLGTIYAALSKYERFGGPAYGIVAEVLLKKVGIEDPRTNYVDMVRGLIVSLIANKVKIEI